MHAHQNKPVREPHLPFDLVFPSLLTHSTPSSCILSVAKQEYKGVIGTIFKVSEEVSI